jgi:hypothetical protein
MSHRALDFHKILLASENIRMHGDKIADYYILDGVSLNTGYDGYSITLKSSKVSLTLHFHNTFNLESPSRLDTENFFKQLDGINNRDYS